MADKYQCEVTGLAETIAYLDGLERGIENAVKEAIGEISAHFVERAEKNAPIWTGDLRASIHSTKPKKEGGEIVAEIVAEGERDGFPYAFVMHEFQTAYQNGPTSPKYGHGPQTAAEPQTEEGGPGGFYLRRVSDYHAQKYTEILTRKVGAVVRTR